MGSKMKKAIAVVKALVRRRRFGDRSYLELPEEDYSVFDEVALGLLAMLMIVTALVVLWGPLCFFGAMLIGVEPAELIQNCITAVTGR